MTERRPVSRGTGMRSRNTTSTTRQGVAARELQEARRRRRKREVMRNRIIFGVVCALILALIIFLITKFVGAVIGSNSKSETSTLTIESNGKIVFEEVVDFDEDTYSKSELKSYIKDLISSFNETYGNEAIKLEKLSVSGDNAYVKTTYADAEAYSSFTSYQTYNNTYEKAVEAGYDFNDTFSAVSEGTKGEGQKVDTDSAFAGKMVIVVNENVTVVVPGTVQYVSENSTEVLSDNSIKIFPADGNEDSTQMVYIIYAAD